MRYLKLPFKSILAAVLALLIIACNNDNKEPQTIKVQEVNLHDIKQEEPKNEPPPPPPRTLPPKVEMLSCFSNEGMKYKTVINISRSSNGVHGSVSSEEHESGQKEVVEFTGTMNGDKVFVKFKGKPPVIGDASEWTDKPWIIEKVEGKSEWPEMLHIIFRAKDYEINKWKETEYLFSPVDCK